MIVASLCLERDKSVAGLLPEFARSPVVLDAAVEEDVLVIALRLLRHLEFYVEQLTEVLRQIRQLLEIEAAQMQVGLYVLQRVVGDDAVAPHQPVGELRR